MKTLELDSYSHGYGQITYHIVLVPEYRHKIFRGAVKRSCEKVIQDICDKNRYHVISLHVADDHVHYFVVFYRYIQERQRSVLAGLPRRCPYVSDV